MALANLVTMPNLAFSPVSSADWKTKNLTRQTRMPYLRKSTNTIVCKAVVPSETMKKLDPAIPIEIPDSEIQRKNFPPDFLFGCSSSAFQTEGAGDEGGRGPATQDKFIQMGAKPGERLKAVDSYNRYKDDVRALKDMGANAYRFSISWSRIFQDGTFGTLNPEGVRFYNDLINELLDNGITPFATLHHFDLPKGLQDKYGGFLDRRIVDDFKAYADFCFEKFGNRVQHWNTINEPQVFGKFFFSPNPAKVTAQESFLASHHIILSHAAAAKLYQKEYKPSQNGEIGIPLVAEWSEPHNPASKDDKEAAERAFDFTLGWFLSPLVFGHYPSIMQKIVPKGILPEFKDKDKELVKGAYDFVGVNYYTSYYASHKPVLKGQTYRMVDEYKHIDRHADRNGVFIGEEGPGRPGEIYVYPDGLKDALVYMHKNYKKPKMYITENGYPEKRDDTLPLEDALNDQARIRHMKRHLYAIQEARKQGVDVHGYLMWALMDCPELEKGYDVRFGVYYTDYLNNLNRIPKESAKWFKSFMG